MTVVEIGFGLAMLIAAVLVVASVRSRPAEVPAMITEEWREQHGS